MSPELKDKNIQGSLQQRQWEMKPPANELVEDAKLITMGSAMRGLTGAADNLLKAATKLEREVRRETKYWDQVLGVTERGWAVFRYGGDRRTLAVQFSAQEAGPGFGNRGVAALRSNEDGSIKLDRGLTMTPKAIRVRIANGSEIVDSTTVSLYGAATESDSDLEIMIRRARDSLFEEELFHEMVLETRNLLGFGVQYRNNVIHVPSSARGNSAGGNTLLIDLIPLDQPPEHFVASNSSQLSSGVALFARLLMSHLFRQRLRTRTEIPKPLSNSKKEEAAQPILKPILAQYQHYQALSRLLATLNDINAMFTAASIPFDLATSRSSTASAGKPVVASQKSEDSSFSLVEALCQPLKSTINIKLPSGRGSVANSSEAVVDVQTVLSPQANARDLNQIYGTQYELSLPPEVSRLLLGVATLPADHPSKHLFSNPADLIEYLRQVLLADATNNIIAPQMPRWKVVSRQCQLGKTVSKSGKKQEFRIGVEIRGGKLKLWKRLALAGIELKSSAWGGSDQKTPESLLASAQAWAKES